MLHVGSWKVSSVDENVGHIKNELKHAIPMTAYGEGNTSSNVICANCSAKITGNADDENHKNPDTLEEFASTTTMHGVSFYYNSKSTPLKAFWIILLLGMAAMLTYQIVDRLIAYFQFEMNTSITQEFVVSMPFPAVTICTFNRFYLESPGTGLINAIHQFNQLITPENVAINQYTDYRPNLTDISQNFDGDIDVKRLLKRYGFSLDEQTMPRCNYKYEECEAADFSEVLSWMGICHTFNNGNASKIQSIPGAGHGLSVTLNIRKDAITEEPVVGLRDFGLRVQVHQRGEIPDVGSFGISIPAGRKASIEVSRHDFNLMYQPWGSCDPSRENLKFFSVYTLNNCVQECYTNALLEKCGCYLFTQYWAEGHGRECTTEEMQNCASEYLIAVQQIFSAETCNCTVPCSYTEYDSSASYATFPNPPTTRYLRERLNYSEDDTLGNTVEFDVYFKTMSYTKFTQSKKVDESGLLSDIGGQLGLWLGMSIITAVELVQFCARKICGCGKKKTT